MVLPPPFVNRLPHPRVIWNNASHHRTLGTPNAPSNPAPSIVLRDTNGRSRPITMALQGLIEDDGSQLPEHWSVTNCLILRIQ